MKTKVPDWARAMTEEVFGPAPFAVGDLVWHPDGRRVRIIDGQYWGLHGLSNHWTWRPVFPDGTMGPPESGHGWRLPAEKLHHQA
jgi:hypothetical protein